ncbi:hypothetical protein [Marinagarivorans algicola]|nr:hypothetical protein [Marinagarivorans algicola]
MSSVNAPTSEYTNLKERNNPTFDLTEAIKHQTVLQSPHQPNLSPKP